MSAGRSSPVASLLAVAALACAAAGCSGGNLTPNKVPIVENLVSRADIRAAPPGSPYRALLEWWRAVQFEDYPTYVSMLSARLRAERVPGGRARRAIALVAGSFIPAKPTVLSTTRAGPSRVTLYTRIYVRQPVGASRTYLTSVPQAFSLVRERGRWRIADDSYVENKVATIEALQQALKPKATR